jgi:broad specificity phosphatase PhoE
MAVTRVVFIRPGETDWNRDGRWQGWVAAPLNDHGRRQVSQLAKFVRHIGMSALYSSDLKRAMQTADILGQQLGFAPIPDPRLRERDIGDWQGMTPAEMEAWYPEQYQQLLADRENYQVPGGESRAEVRKRALAAIEDIMQQDKGETVGILSHSTAIRVMLKHLIADCDERNVALVNTSVTTIMCDDSGQWRLVAADDVMHLEGLETKQVGELEFRP